MKFKDRVFFQIDNGTTHYSKPFHSDPSVVLFSRFYSSFLTSAGEDRYLEVALAQDRPKSGWFRRWHRYVSPFQPRPVHVENILFGYWRPQIVKRPPKINHSLNYPEHSIDNVPCLSQCLRFSLQPQCIMQINPWPMDRWQRYMAYGIYIYSIHHHCSTQQSINTSVPRL